MTESLNIWFVPTNSSHMGKWKALLPRLAQDHNITLLCLDQLTDSLNSTLAEIRSSGFPFHVVEVPGYVVSDWQIIQLSQRRKVCESIRRILKKHTVDVLVFGSDIWFPARMVVRVARSLNIPSVLIPDGLVVPLNPSYQPSLLFKIKRSFLLFSRGLWRCWGIRGGSGVESVLVMNTSGLDELVKSGIPQDRVHVVGSPEYDELKSRIESHPAVNRTHLLEQMPQVHERRPIIFFAHQEVQPLPEMRGLVLALMKAARSVGGFLLVKFHPRSVDEPSSWISWAQQKGFGPEDVTFLRNEMTSIDAVRLCDICVVIYSTVAIEAMLLRKPVMIIQYFHLMRALDYSDRYDAAIDITDSADLKERIERLTKDPTLRERIAEAGRIALEQELLGPDGKSVERIAAFIREAALKPGADSPRVSASIWGDS